jgi:hypothetical protein
MHSYTEVVSRDEKLDVSLFSFFLLYSVTLPYNLGIKI